MSGKLDIVQANRLKEQEYKRHHYELKKLKTKHIRTFESEKAKQKDRLSKMKENYDVKFSNLKNSFERKLITIRNKQKDLLAIENERLANELKDLKVNHEAKIAELKITQDNEKNELLNSHRKILDNAQQKFLKEKAKLE